jgi:hypothetical protein
MARRDKIPWPVRSVLAGSVGTATLTLCYATERRVRHTAKGTPLDYDDSLVPGEIVAAIFRLHQLTDHREQELGLALRWGYGSVFGLWHGLLRGRIAEPGASLAFGGTLISATLTLFPLLGKTPPPWRWSPQFLATSLFTHAAYVLAVGVVDDSLRERS